MRTYLPIVREMGKGTQWRERGEGSFWANVEKSNMTKCEKDARETGINVRKWGGTGILNDVK